MRKEKTQKRVRNEINIVAPRGYKGFLKKLAYKILAVSDRSPAEIGIILTSDEEIRKLNREYRGKDKPTDVLSFPIDEYIDGVWIVGDIVISIDRAKEQAEGDLKDEIKRLVVHGFVHLMGYDHELGEEEAILFEKIERSILEKLDHLS